MNRFKPKQAALGCATLLLLALSAQAQYGFRGARAVPQLAPPSGDDAEFAFVRLQYANALSAYGRRGRGRGSWLTDYDSSEIHFLRGVTRLTRVEASPSYWYVDLSDDTVMNYPFLYAVEVGRWSLSDEQVVRLREYLLRGGFLIVDDFWGTAQWATFIDSMQRVFPDRPIVELEESHEILHVLYDLNERIQIPGISFLWSGVTYQQDGYVPHWRGIYDDDGRLMVGINFNMDLGDAWEHADNPQYPEPMTALAYRYAVNYVVYSMSH
jgi:Domain of unknown function (DUF4159)